MLSYRICERLILWGACCKNYHYLFNRFVVYVQYSLLGLISDSEGVNAYMVGFFWCWSFFFLYLATLGFSSKGYLVPPWNTWTLELTSVYSLLPRLHDNNFPLFLLHLLQGLAFLYNINTCLGILCRPHRLSWSSCGYFLLHELYKNQQNMNKNKAMVV